VALTNQREAESESTAGIELMITTRSQVLSDHEILVRYVKRWAAGASASMLTTDSSTTWKSATSP
jgi:hypothetical protein